MVELIRTDRFAVVSATPLVSAEVVERSTGVRVLSDDAVASVPPVEPVPALHFADGHVVSIDGTMLIGRSPRVERAATAQLPRLVPVGDDSAAISRTHLRISIEGERILLEDLDSTNGTAIVPVAGVPFRLAPGEPAVLTDGMVVTIADHLAFRVVSA